MMDTCYYVFVKSIEYTTPRMNPNANYGLGNDVSMWVHQLWQTYHPSAKMSIVGEAVCMWRQGKWGICLICLINFAEPKTAIKGYFKDIHTYTHTLGNILNTGKDKRSYEA